jgi:cell division transport system ATP-binding protein
VIELRNVSFAFNGKAILQDVSFTVDKGDFAVVVGNTGSGKTTLVQLLIGELIPSAGEIYVGQTQVDQLRKKQLAGYRRSIGIISEEVGLLDEKSVAENVALPLEIVGKRRLEPVHKSVTAQLETVNLQAKAKSAPKELSLGEYQRAAIARALISEPLILIADCPTVRLDPTASADILSILDNQNVRGMTIFLTMSELPDRRQFPSKTVFYRLLDGIMQPFLPETLE